VIAGCGERLPDSGQEEIILVIAKNRLLAAVIRGEFRTPAKIALALEDFIRARPNHLYRAKSTAEP
jgi:hypothetical protein